MDKQTLRKIGENLILYKISLMSILSAIDNFRLSQGKTIDFSYLVCNTMTVHDKHFSVDEARRLIAEFRPVVEQIVHLKQTLDQMGFDVYRHQYFGGAGPNGQRFFPAELEQLVSLVHKLQQHGILVKSLDDGLLDFPHFRENGEEVYLCWKLGEDDLTSWHTIREGFADRKSLSLL